MEKRIQKKREGNDKARKAVSMDNGQQMKGEFEAIEELLFPQQYKASEPTLAQWEKINKKIVEKLGQLEQETPSLHQRLTTIKDRLTCTDSQLVRFFIPVIIILLAILFIILALLLFGHKEPGELLTGLLLWPIIYK